MVLRTFSAVDSTALRIDASSPHGTPGNSIINNSDTQTGTIFEFTGGYQDHQITLNDTSWDNDTFNDDRESQHTIVDGKGIVANGTAVESESHIYLRQLGDDGEPFGPTIDITVFSQNGQTSNIWGFATDTSLVDGARYVKVGGSNRGDSDYVNFTDVDGAPCFVTGTRIVTPDGDRLVERLGPGDIVSTSAGGQEAVIWVGSSTLTFAPTSEDQPIRFSPNTLGPGRPDRALLVSPQHRMLIRAGQDELLVPAKGLLPLRGVRQMRGLKTVTYVHVLLARHAVVISNGAASESLYPGAHVQRMLGDDRFCDLMRQVKDGHPYGPLARRCLTVQQTLRWARSNRDFFAPEVLSA